MQDTGWGGVLPSAEVQSVYSTAPANWGNERVRDRERERERDEQTEIEK